MAVSAGATQLGLDDAAEESQEIIVVPDVAWSRISQLETGQRYYAAAVVVPVRVRGEGARETDPPLDATIGLYWDRPFLPTAGEMRLLDVLAALATWGAKCCNAATSNSRS